MRFLLGNMRPKRGQKIIHRGGAKKNKKKFKKK